ncbi:Terminal uridylyltransferase 7 [Symbiodinium microadriaticum]|uniref:Terminal uridylyltransferase 7 n=1 Tax=Symbiodinium microadriaticum TaxID=2951 RepID=A0A1Q9DW25_SYMMI|nr:Terminal uridylyltransferase 7 [Symbiodinium microadriaticum]
MASCTLRRAGGLRWTSPKHIRWLGRPVTSETDRLEASWRLFSRSSTAKPSGSSMEALSQEISEYFLKTRPTEDELEAKDMLFRKIESAGKASLDGCRAEAFGSAGCGQWTAGSDLDICLLAPGVTERHSQVRGLKKVASILRQSGASHNIEPRFGAQMPILRWTPRRPGRLSSIACDISVANVLAVANTQLIAAYLKVDDRVPPLLRVIKVHG